MSVSETPTSTASASLTASATATPTPDALINVAPQAAPSLQFTATATVPPTGGDGIQPTAPAPPEAPLAAANPVNVTAANVSQLITQINAANSRCPTPTVITLTASTYTLTAVADASFFGNNGLPIIRCDITITGGSTNRYIQRSTTGPLFRIFGVDSTGILRLNRVIVRYGRASATGGSGILIIQGQAYLTNSQVLSNTLSLTTTAQIIGAGIYNYLGTLRVENSTVSSNTNTSTTPDGGGIGIIGGTTAVLGSTVNSNRANRSGGGIAVVHSNAVVTVQTSRIQNNLAGEGGGISSRAYSLTITRSLIQGNTLTSGSLGAAIFGGKYFSNPVVNNSCFISNGDTAAYAPGGSTLEGQNNWWGSTAGPVVNGTSVNPRDSVNSPGVNYQPFVTTAPPNPAVNCINGIVPPTPTPTPTAPFCPAGGDAVAAQTCPTNTPTPTPTQTALPTTWHVVCNVSGGVANARNFPSAIFVGATPTPQIDGQVLMTVPFGTLLTVYQIRKDSNGVNWVRITDFGAYNGETLWIREFDASGVVPIVAQGNPTNCSARPFNLAATPRPTVAGTFPTVPPGCNTGNLCPLLTTPPSEISDEEAVAWILACEAGNNASAEAEADALGIAHVIRNRMRSLLYEGTAREVISQQGQFDCWSQGAPSNSGLATVNSVADPDITEFARRLVQGQPPLPDPFNNGIRWYGLYTYGLFNDASNRDNIRQTPTAVIATLSAICTPPGGIGNIYIDLAVFGSTRVNATAFFSSFPDC